MSRSQMQTVCPIDGVIKETAGVWYQVFNVDGKCIEQCFVAQDSEYQDANGTILSNENESPNYNDDTGFSTGDNPRHPTDFYHPYECVKPVVD